MSRLPLFAYNLMKGKWEVFPWEMLRTMPNGKLGFTEFDLQTNRGLYQLYNNYWYAFDAHSTTLNNSRYYTIKDLSSEKPETVEVP